MHNQKNKNCQKSTCDERHSALRNPIFGGTHECDCTCRPEQKEEVVHASGCAADLDGCYDGSCLSIPEQKEEWENTTEWNEIHDAIENIEWDNEDHYDGALFVVDTLKYFLSTQICLAEERGRDAQQKEDYKIAKAQQEKAFKSGIEMGETRGRRNVVEDTRTSLLFIGEKVLGEMNKIYAINIKYADKKQWLEPAEFERIFLHRFNESTLSTLTQKS